MSLSQSSTEDNAVQFERDLPRDPAQNPVRSGQSSQRR